MKHILFFFCRLFRSIRIRCYHKIYLPFLRSQFKECGEEVVIDRDCKFAGTDHIHLGSHIYIGPGAVIYSLISELYIGNYVNFGPNVTIMTGDHRTDVIGEYMKQLTNEMKLPENDLDVVIEDDVWVGTGAIILKGIRIGKGSVVAAGAVVTKDVPPYTVFISSSKQKVRFTKEQILEHETRLKENYPQSN